MLCAVICFVLLSSCVCVCVCVLLTCLLFKHIDSFWISEMKGICMYMCVCIYVCVYVYMYVCT